MAAQQIISVGFAHLTYQNIFKQPSWFSNKRRASKVIINEAAVLPCFLTKAMIIAINTSSIPISSKPIIVFLQQQLIQSRYLLMLFLNYGLPVRQQDKSYRVYHCAYNPHCKRSEYFSFFVHSSPRALKIYKFFALHFVAYGR